MSKFSLEITAGVTIPENNLDRMALIRALGALHVAAPISTFRVKEKLVPAPPAGFLAFSYHYVLMDGRVWDETHSYPSPPTGAPPFMDVKGGLYPNPADLGWTIVEIALQRPIRDLVFKMVPEFTITDLFAKWT